MAIVSGKTRDVWNCPDEQVGAVLGANGRAEAATAGALRSGLHSMLSYSTGEIGRLGEALALADDSSGSNPAQIGPARPGPLLSAQQSW